MRSIALLFVLFSVSLCRGDGPAKLPLVDKLFSMQLPDGFQWTKVKEVDDKDVKARFYVATKDGSTLRMVLAAELTPRQRDEQRIAAIKAHYNELTESLVKAGFKGLKVKEPSLETPIAEEVPFAIAATTPDGTAVIFYCTSIFRRNTYLLQLVSESADDLSEQSIKLAKSLIEPKI